MSAEAVLEGSRNVGTLNPLFRGAGFGGCLNSWGFELDFCGSVRTTDFLYLGEAFTGRLDDCGACLNPLAMHKLISHESLV